MSKDDEGGNGDMFRRAMSTPGDYAAFLLGTVAGVVADIASGGISLAQGTVGGGALALGIKKGVDGAFAKRRLKRKCDELGRYYLSVNDPLRAHPLYDLKAKIEAVSSMTAAEIQKQIDRICKE
jgi:hypothetical protein